LIISSERGRDARRFRRNKEGIMTLRLSTPLCLLAAVICLCPDAAQALDPTSTATGTGALASECCSGRQNTADGYYALGHTTGGIGNTASGYYALRHNTVGFKNTANGWRALRSNTTGFYNTASGSDALYSNSTGAYNTASGTWALFNNSTGKYNTASGTGALDHLNGNGNIALGAYAGYKTTSGDNNIYIGHPGISGSESRVVRIGREQTRTFITGIAGTALSGATVVVKSNGQLGVVASSARYKQDIKPLGSAVEKLAQLRPISYRYKTEPEATHYGLIAEEVDRVMPELVVRDEQNRPETVQYQELIPLLLQQWKKQQAEIVRQRALIERQEAALRELRQMLATRLAALDAADTGARAGSK
jgi:hypothetical protein